MSLFLGLTLVSWSNNNSFTLNLYFVGTYNDILLSIRIRHYVSVHNHSFAVPIELLPHKKSGFRSVEGDLKLRGTLVDNHSNMMILHRDQAGNKSRKAQEIK